MRLAIRLNLGLSLLALLVAQPSAAHAQPRPAADASFLERMRARLELGLGRRSDRASSFHVLSPLLAAEYAFSHGFGVGIDWGFVLAVESPARGDSGWFAGQGDPLLKVWYTSAAARDRYTLYLGLSVPTAWLPRSVVSRGLARNAYAFAAVSRGLWNAWLWAPEQIALAAAARYQRELDPHLRLVVEAGAAVGLSLSRLIDGVGTLYAQLAPALELHDTRFALGLRPQAVLTTSGTAALQLAAALYMRLQLSAATELELSGLCNLSGSLGLMSRSLPVCGAQLAVGVSP